MKKILIILVSLVFLFLFISSSFAEFRCLWKNKKLIKDVALSEKQVNTIKELSIKTEKDMIKVRSEIELKQIDLREVLDADKPDEGKAVGLIKEIMKLKTDARILKTKQMISIKKTLTPEQMEKFQEFKREHHMRKVSKHKKGDHIRPEHHMKP